jgi:hypothetical protein
MSEMAPDVTGTDIDIYVEKKKIADKENDIGNISVMKISGRSL